MEVRLQSSARSGDVSLPDEGLVAAWERGDREAFARLFERYQGKAQGYALRMLGRRELAEEVCTDVFMTVLEGRWRPEGSFRGYLFTVLHRRCLEVLRRTSTRQRLSIHVATALPEPPPDVAMSASAEQARLEWAMGALAEEHRGVLLLYYAQELSSREVAEVLGCSDQQVRSRLSYARRKLRELLEES